MFEATHQDTINTTSLADVCGSASFVCGRCPQSACPECYPGGQPISQQQCCQQRSIVQALTASSIQAAVNAIASAQAAVAVATKAIVGVSAAASAAALVSVTESISIGSNTSANCNLSHEVVAMANGYSAAFAMAAAEAEGAAVATANASAAASASAAAAAKLFATAESLLNSTCCGFDLQTYQLAIIAGQYITNASMSASEARNIAAAAFNTSGMLQTANSVLNETASSFLNNTIENCCNEFSLTQKANQTVAHLLSIINAGFELNTIIGYTSDQITAYGIDNNTLEMAATSIAASNTSECANYPAGCCLNSACCNQSTVSMASQAIVDVLLSSASIAQAYVDVAVETMAVVEVVSAALANATAAVVAATRVSTAFSITKTSCYSITINIHSEMFAQARAVANSFAAAAAAATAVSNASSSAYALALSTARGVALAQSAVLSFGVGCCESPCCGSMNYSTYTNYTLSDTYSVYSCCDIIASYKYANSQKAAQLTKDACSTAFKELSEVSAVADSKGASDFNQIGRGVVKDSRIVLDIVCCTTSPTTKTNIAVVTTSKNTGIKVVNGPNVGNVQNIIGNIKNILG